jgi:S1-C subfamily serine protease
MAALAGSVDPSIVDTIVFGQPAGTQILGSGIILEGGGLILTAAHVVRDEVFVGVRVGGVGRVIAARVVATDAARDLALLRVDGSVRLRPASLGPGPALIGEPVAVIGNAMGLGGVPRLTAGRLVALDQSIGYGVGSSTVHLAGTLEAAAPIAVGDSGGALIDGRGRVIGVIAAAAGGSCSPTLCAMRVAYAIPIGRALTDLRLG